MSSEIVKLTQFCFTGEIKSCEITANFTGEIRSVKLGVFSFSPIAHVCEAVKLRGVYIPMVYTPSSQLHKVRRARLGGFFLLSSIHRFTEEVSYEPL